MAAVEPQLCAAEGIRAKRKQPESLDAWECVVRALSCVNSRSQNDYAMARELLERAIELDPAYAQAHALFAQVMGLEVLYGWKPGEIALARALEAAQKASDVLALNEARVVQTLPKSRHEVRDRGRRTGI